MNGFLIMIKIQKYLPQEYQVKLQLKKFVIGAIRKQDTSKALELLRTNLIGMESYSHLKRIRKRNNEEESIDFMMCCEDEVDLLDNIRKVFGELITKEWIEQLPFSNPVTKEQYAEWSKIWPLQFIEQQVYKETKHSKQQLDFLHKIASNQDKEIVLFNEKQEILMSKTIKEQCRNGTIQHSIMKMLEEWPHTQQYKQLPNAYYLTRLWLYSSVPICLMCSMALVHSRLERIYFPHHLSIAEVSEILCCSKLNHRIKIFKVVTISESQ